MTNVLYKQVLPLDENVIALIEKLNQYQINLYGREKCSLDSPEVLQQSQAFMVGAYANELLIGIGAVKFFDDYAEIKRMYIEENFRGLSIAEHILTRLEEHAAKNGIHKICLETGTLHHAAQKFYQKMGYTSIERFGNYPLNEVSVFLGKDLNAG